MKKLLIATSNPSKVEEYKELLSDLPLELVSLADIGLPSVEEMGETFEENALLKVRSYFEQSGLPCIADDGGLEIDVLNCEPGVKSHRWINGKDEASDAELIAYTLKRMEGYSGLDRAAKLTLWMAYKAPDGSEHVAKETIEGLIAEKPGFAPEGFPFRALLYIPQFEKMYQDLSPEEHAQVNHRQKALMMIRPFIEDTMLM